MNITYQHYRLTLRAEDRLLLPCYKGSTFRGAFGNTFKRIVCALRRQECGTCMLKTSCIYAYVFETVPAGNATIMGMGRYRAIPHPFVIEPPLETDRIYEAGEEISLGLVLIGKAVDYLPYFVYTFEEMGKTGIGKGRGKHRLIDVQTATAPVYSMEERAIRPQPAETVSIPEKFSFDGGTSASLTLNFLTPLRIFFGRSLNARPDFHILIRSLLRRLNLLHYFHVDRREAEWDHRGIIAAAETVVTEKNATQWWDWERYSARQQVRMKMGGLIGTVTYGGNIEPFSALLRAGEIFHVGKGTSFGLGKYEIQVPRQSSPFGKNVATLTSLGYN